jgi:hypothetical protein
MPRPAFVTKHLRLWLEFDRHSFEHGYLAARFPPRHTFGTGARNQVSASAGFADLGSLQIKDAEQLPSLQQAVTTFSILPIAALTDWCAAVPVAEPHLDLAFSTL